MIGVYAQAPDRQGLDAAFNGVAIEDTALKLIELRERGRSVVGCKAIQIGGVELRYSRGICRLVFDDSKPGCDGSPITVVIDMDAVPDDLGRVVTVVTEGVHAIHRSVDAEPLRAAIGVAAEIHRSHLSRRRIVIAGSIVVIAGIVITAAVLIVGALSRQ